MTARFSLFEFMPYGAPELKAAARGHMLRAQAASCALMIALFAAAALLVPRTPRVAEIVLPPPPHEPQHIVPNFRLPPPPVPEVAIAHGPDVGVPVPVAAEPKVEDVIAPPNASDADGTGPASSTERVGPAPSAPPVSEDPMPVRGVYNPVDELPVAITQPLPIYPELARQANIEGKVIVHILIGKDGRVLRAELNERVHVPILDQAALDGAKKWVFTPAMRDGRAVPVWETIPFEFTLH